jgi:methylmalonyl-CoA/ethylmalonyl-CoA epimerase
MFTLDHIGIVVAELEPAVELYCRLLGYPAEAVEYHDVPTEGVRVAMLTGNTKLELIQPTAADGALMRFLDKRGPGFHHFCFGAPAPLEDKLAELKDAGLRLLDDSPRTGAEGRVFFVHPKSAGGILTEFVEENNTADG